MILSIKQVTIKRSSYSVNIIVCYLHQKTRYPYGCLVFILYHQNGTGLVLPGGFVFVLGINLLRQRKR